MTDPIGRIITELRDDSGVSAITTRIRGGEAAPGDALGPGKYVPFVVLVHLGATRDRSLPVQQARILARCYGTTYQNAAELAGAVSDALHAKGPRISGSGVGIYASFDDVGQGASADPDTGQPHQDLIFAVYLADRLLGD